MRICVDARQVRAYPTGLGSYARHLVRHLAAADRDNEYVVLRHDPVSPVVEQDNFREIAVPYTILTARNMLAGAAAVRRVEADIYHSLFHFLPLGGGLPKTVVTLLDLIAVEHSALSLNSRPRRWWKSGWVRPLLRQALRRADHVVAISDSTRDAALAHYGLDPDRISTVRLGVDPRQWNGPDDTEASDLAGAPDRRFIFCLGNTHPYKNIPRLLSAFASIASTYPDVDLIVTGRGSTYAALRKLASRLGIETRVKLTAHASDSEVKSLLKKALFFAFPSLVEGFGLPVLEAMASGCPVLTSDCSALREIAEDAAVLVDPTDPEAIAAGMSRLIQDENLRRDLVGRGKARADAMTWERAAEGTIAVYRALASRA